MQYCPGAAQRVLLTAMTYLLTLTVLTALVMAATAADRCPNKCSGRGMCSARTGRCKCEHPYFGKDCSKTCPGTFGNIECWAQGECSPTLQKCKCHSEFLGDDCTVALGD